MITVGCSDSTEETGVRVSVARNTPRGSMICLGNEVPVLSDTQGVGPPPPLHTRPCLHRLWKGTPTRASEPQFAATACGSLLLQTLCAYPSVATVPLPGLSEQVCPSRPLLLLPLAWAENRCLRVAHTQKWGCNQSWAPGAVQLGKRNGNLSVQLHMLWIKSPPSAC